MPDEDVETVDEAPEPVVPTGPGPKDAVVLVSKQENNQ
jgi:hypothetical protein